MGLASGVLSLPKLGLNPLVSGPLLLALLTSPETVQKLFAERLRIDAGAHIGLAKRVLQILLAIGSLRYINGVFSRMATNAGRLGAAEGWNWSHEVAVVTGGCSGIGYQTVKRLAERNIKVAILDVQEMPESLNKIRNIHYFKCDVTSAEDVARAAKSINEILGRPSILVNNAGIARPASILEQSRKDVQKVFEINTFAHWTTVQQFLPHMIAENRGHVVTIASIVSYLTAARATDYSASKAAAMAFHEGLSSELRYLYKTTGVLSSIVHPTLARTPLGDDVLRNTVGGQGGQIEPDDVADAVAKTVFGRQSRKVFVPESLSWLARLRGYPAWMQEGIRGRLGKMAANVQVS